MLCYTLYNLILPEKVKNFKNVNFFSSTNFLGHKSFRKKKNYDVQNVSEQKNKSIPLYKI